jgi:sugar phosphate isomerase/epimerase
MANVISCRTGVFGSVDAAFEWFPKGGVFHAEVPPAEDYDDLAKRAAAHGVTIATLATPLNVSDEANLRSFRTVVDGAARIGVSRIFISAQNRDGVPRETAIERLRNTAAYAHERGVVLCMETHPPFGTNGDTARETIEAVGHPGLRFNFDTANIYYYNEGTDTASELRKVAPYVQSVHVKDTDGGFKSGYFPPLGQGIVDFETVFAVLADVGFDGPYTLEIEGSAVQGLDPEGRLEFLRSCVAFLREHGIGKA